MSLKFIFAINFYLSSLTPTPQQTKLWDEENTIWRVKKKKNTYLPNLIAFLCFKRIQKIHILEDYMKYSKFNFWRIWWQLKAKFIMTLSFQNLLDMLKTLTYSSTCRWALNDTENAGTWNSSKHKSQASLLISFATGGIGSKDCVFLTLYCLGTDCFKMCTPGNNQVHNPLFFFYFAA